MSPLSEPWARAQLAVQLLQVDPVGLGGIWLRARSGPVRDAFMERLGGLPLPLRRIHPSIGDDQLFGGVDLAATLAAGEIVTAKGLLSDQAALVLAMAERCSAGLAARLAQALDGSDGPCLVMLDEGAEGDEIAPEALRDRVAFHIDLEGIGYHQAVDLEVSFDPLAIESVSLPGGAIADIASVAARLGVESLRAPLLTLRAARAHAALNKRLLVTNEDIQVAAELVLGPRATIVPEAEEEDLPPPPPETEQSQDHDQGSSDLTELPEDILLEAVKASLPADLLAKVAAGKANRAAKSSAGSGAKRKGNRRGRPLPARPGRLDGQSKIDLVATLRAAAPWQPMRRAVSAHQKVLHIRPSDIRVRRYEEKSDRLLIFTVDASGSAAMARLGEAKGAIELLLAEAYARRDHVALVSFRGEAAEVLLPPTRSLVQTKRRLAALPGGGGTPLAAGLQAAMELAELGKGRGMTPTLALLTDGRANIALDGTANRAQAAEDAERLARLAQVTGTPGLVIDMGNRPQRQLETLAQAMDAPYLPLPRADAQRLSTAVSAALDG